MYVRNGEEWLNTDPYVKDGDLWVPLDSGQIKNDATYETFYQHPVEEWVPYVFTHVYTADDNAVDPFSVLPGTQADYTTDWRNIASTSLGEITLGDWGVWATVTDTAQEDVTVDGNPPAAQGTVPTSTASVDYAWVGWKNNGTNVIENAWNNWNTVELEEQQFPYQFSNGNPPSVSNITVPSDSPTVEYRNPLYVYSRQDTVINAGEWVDISGSVEHILFMAAMPTMDITWTTSEEGEYSYSQPLINEGVQYRFHNFMSPITLHRRTVSEDIVHFWKPTYEKRTREPATTEYRWLAQYQKRERLGSWGPWLDVVLETVETGTSTEPATAVSVPANTALVEYRNPAWVAAGSEKVYGTWSGWDVITLAEQQFSYQYSSTNSPVADIDVPANTNIAEYQNPEWVYSRQDVVTVTVMSTFIESESVFDIYLRPLYTETVLWSDLLSYPDPTLVSKLYDPAKKDYYHGVGPSVISGHVSIGSYDGDTIDHRDFIDFETSPLWSITPNGQSSVALSTLSPEPAALTPPTSPNHNVTWIGWEETRVRTGIVNNVDYSDAVDVTLEDLTIYASLAESLGKATFDSTRLTTQPFPAINFNTLFDLGFSPNYFVWDSHELTPSKYGTGYQTVLLRGFKWGKGQRLRVWEPKFHYEELADVTYHYWNPTYEQRTRSMSTVYKWDGMVEKRDLLGDWGPWLATDMRTVVNDPATMETSVDTSVTVSELPPVPTIANTSEEEYQNFKWVYGSQSTVTGDWSDWGLYALGLTTSTSGSTPSASAINVPSNTGTEEYQNPHWLKHGSETYSDWSSWRTVYGSYENVDNTRYADSEPNEPPFQYASNNSTREYKNKRWELVSSTKRRVPSASGWVRGNESVVSGDGTMSSKPTHTPEWVSNVPSDTDSQVNRITPWFTNNGGGSWIYLWEYNTNITLRYDLRWRAVAEFRDRDVIQKWGAYVERRTRTIETLNLYYVEAECRVLQTSGATGKFVHRIEGEKRVLKRFG